MTETGGTAGTRGMTAGHLHPRSTQRVNGRRALRGVTTHNDSILAEGQAICREFPCLPTRGGRSGRPAANRAEGRQAQGSSGACRRSHRGGTAHQAAPGHHGTQRHHRTDTANNSQRGPRTGAGHPAPLHAERRSGQKRGGHAALVRAYAAPLAASPRRAGLPLLPGGLWTCRHWPASCRFVPSRDRSRPCLSWRGGLAVPQLEKS